MDAAAGGGDCSSAIAVAKLNVATIWVGGMTCASCVSSLEQSLKKVDGVSKVDVSLITSQAKVEYDCGQLSTDDLVDCIECVGFEATLVDDQSADQANDGLHDRASSRITSVVIEITQFRATTKTIETVIAGIDGLESFKRVAASNKFKIDYDQSRMGIRRIIALMEIAGYKGVLSVADNHYMRMKQVQSAEVEKWRTAFAISSLFGVPSMVAMFVFMFALGHSRTPSVIPGLGLDNVVMFLLASPVQYLVIKYFFVKAYGSVRYGRCANMDVLVCMATSVAYIYSVLDVLVSVLMANFVRQHSAMNPMTFFDVTPMLVMFVSLGRWMENVAKGKTSEALTKLMSLQPTEGLVLLPATGEGAGGNNNNNNGPTELDEHGNECFEHTIGAELIELNDLIKILPGMKVPVDGVHRDLSNQKEGRRLLKDVCFE